MGALKINKNNLKKCIKKTNEAKLKQQVSQVHMSDMFAALVHQHMLPCECDLKTQHPFSLTRHK